MAVVSVKEMFDQRSSHEDDLGRVYTRHYIVVCSVMTDTPYVARTAATIPRKGDSHPDEPYARCRTIDANPYESLPDTYRVDVVYTTPVTGLTGADNPNPLLRPPVISGGSNIITKPLIRADYMGYYRFLKNGTVDYIPDGVDSGTNTERYEGVPVTNSCNLPFTNGPEYEESIPFMTIVKNEPPNLVTIMQNKATYENKVNLDAFGGFAAPGFAKMGVITFTPQIVNDVAFYEVTYTVSFRTDGWNIEILDMGKEEWVAPGPSSTRLNLLRRKITNADGNAVDSDQPLNGEGGLCRDSKPSPLATDVAGAMLVYRQSKKTGAVNFGPLALLG